MIRILFINGTSPLELAAGEAVEWNSAGQFAIVRGPDKKPLAYLPISSIKAIVMDNPAAPGEQSELATFPGSDVGSTPSRPPLQLSSDGRPRRGNMLLWTPAEKAIYDTMQLVEDAGAHPFLTEAVTLLSQARDKVADFVELPKA